MNTSFTRTNSMVENDAENRKNIRAFELCLNTRSNKTVTHHSRIVVKHSGNYFNIVKLSQSTFLLYLIVLSINKSWLAVAISTQLGESPHVMPYCRRYPRVLKRAVYHLMILCEYWMTLCIVRANLYVHKSSLCSE